MVANQICLQSCLVGLGEMACESVHCVITSPPYNLSYPKQKSKKFNLEGYGDFSDCMPEDRYQDEQVEALEAMGRVLRPEGSVFYNHKDRHKNGRLVSPFAWISRVHNLSLFQIIVINRGSSHNVDPWRLPPTTEYLFWFSKPGHRPRFNKACRRWGLVWNLCPHAETGRIPHPAPFSLSIPLRCIMMSGATGNDMVLDPYAGSGTSLVAATILGLSWIAYEINPGYIALTEQRIAAAKAQWCGKEVKTESAKVQSDRSSM